MFILLLKTVDRLVFFERGSLDSKIEIFALAEDRRGKKDNNCQLDLLKKSRGCNNDRMVMQVLVGTLVALFYLAIPILGLFLRLALSRIILLVMAATMIILQLIILADRISPRSALATRPGEEKEAPKEFLKLHGSDTNLQSSS